MENGNKIFSYFGFAKKSGKLKTGANTVGLLKGKVYLVVVCSEGSENAQKEAASFAKKFHCPLLRSDKIPLAELVNKEDCKIAAITDMNLARAIADNAGDGFTFLMGGQKG
ncbi:MAG: hypothetical protein J5903_03730 [Clostridia bacterium]|nr:hypothetical protein [Clostridia bacterium]